ncbi:hypothetical protein DFA_00845 [Cavenderia fasciculata]|uniref:Uncharacterized protein n=1 Tax=Cavenderia fasciculata TaxID=261658 RepID=F4PU50_CACFS|nr:uncharacterized protein DFA_00845 [Cavenderia fasciculata]EGG20976.1 hypothetical protein DFA_00845 [Cavenderia fasciculata]|eukprot:XP_004358826.1 hypothetical protein DFA_00845 [Cavenderia fasciculata]
MIDSVCLFKFILNNKPLRIVIFQHVTSIHQQLGIKIVKSNDLESLYDYIKFNQTDLFIKHFDRLYQLILLVDNQSKRYKRNKSLDLSFLNNNYIERLYWLFDIIFEKNNHVAMKYLIDRLAIAKQHFQSYKPYFAISHYQITTEMFNVLRDANFSTTVPFLQHEMINVLVRLGDYDQLESYLSKLDNPTLSSSSSSSSSSRHPFKKSFSYLLANNINNNNNNNNNNDNKDYILRIIDIFKRYSINVIEDVLIGALESNHLGMIKWVIENVPEKKLIVYCQDHVIFGVLETHCKKEVLEMLPIQLIPPYACFDWRMGREAVKQGNFDFLEYFISPHHDNSHEFELLIDTLAYGRLDCFELILSKYQQKNIQMDQTIIDKIHPTLFSIEFVSRLIGLGFNVHLFNGTLQAAIQSNQLDTLIELGPPQLRSENFTKLLGCAIECNSLSSIDVLLHHPRFQGFLLPHPTININCITPQTIPTIEYLFSKSTTIPIITLDWDFSSSSPIDYVSVSKVIRLVYRPNIIGHCQLIGIFLFANDTKWLFEQYIIKKDPGSVSALFYSDRGGILTHLFDIACHNEHYQALDFLFDRCSPGQTVTHLLLTSLVRIPNDQQFERFWTKIVSITDQRIVTSIVSIIFNIILCPRDPLQTKRLKFIVDMYGTLYSRHNNNNKVPPIGFPSMVVLDHNPYANYPTLMEVFCYQKVPWIINYSVKDELKIFQKAISVGYILPIPKFLDNDNNNNNNNQLDQKSKYSVCLFKFILNNKHLRIVIFQHVTSIHQQLGIKIVKSNDLESLYDYIKYGQTDLFIKHFDHLHQLILLVDKQSKEYKRINKSLDLSFLKNNYIERLYWLFDIIFEKNNHVAMKHLIDRLALTKHHFRSYNPYFTPISHYQITPEMLNVLRDANFSTTVPFLQHEMINVLVRLGDCDQLESYLSKLDNPTLSSSSSSHHPLKSSFSYLLANNKENNNSEMINILKMIDIFKRYSVDVIGDVLIGALESNHLGMIKWVIENVPEKKLIVYCQDHAVFGVLEAHCKKEVLEMLPIQLIPSFAICGSNAIRRGNLDFLEYILILKTSTPPHLQNAYVKRMLTQSIEYGRMDCFELILSKYQADQLQPNHTTITKIHPSCFSIGLVVRLIGLGFGVHLLDGIIETAIHANQLDILDECNSIDILKHPRLQEFRLPHPTININCITPQTIPTIEYLFSKSTTTPIQFSWDCTSTSFGIIDFVSVSKMIRLVYRPDIIGHCQLIGIFLLANDIEWLFDQKIITKDDPGSISDLFKTNTTVLKSIIDIACRNGRYQALDFIFDHCLPTQINGRRPLASLVRIPDDQQFERFWKKIVITESRVAVAIVLTIIDIILCPRYFGNNPKRAKIMLDIYGTLYSSSQNKINHLVPPIGSPSINDMHQNYLFAHYPTLLEVFCYQNVPWIINYSIADELKIFQKAISFGYILPIPKFLDNDNNNNNNNNNQIDQKSKCILIAIIFQHVTSIHQQLGIKTVKSIDLEPLYDYIKFNQTDLFIKHFDRLYQLILLVDKQSKEYKKVNKNNLDLSFLKNNYIERLYYLFHIIFEKNNHVAMKYLIDRLALTKHHFRSFKPYFTTSRHFKADHYQFTTEMFNVLRDANFSTTVPFLQHEMINVLVRLGDYDQLESYLSKLDNPTLSSSLSSSSSSRHPFKKSFSYLLANNNNNNNNNNKDKEMINILRMIDIFKRYSINVIGDVLIGALKSNHLGMIKWVIENVPEKKLIAYCQDLVIFGVLEIHGKKEALEMLPIPPNPSDCSYAIMHGNFDFLDVSSIDVLLHHPRFQWSLLPDSTTTTIDIGYITPKTIQTIEYLLDKSTTTTTTIPIIKFKWDFTSSSPINYELVSKVIRLVYRPDIIDHCQLIGIFLLANDIEWLFAQKIITKDDPGSISDLFGDGSGILTNIIDIACRNGYYQALDFIFDHCPPTQINNQMVLMSLVRIPDDQQFERFWKKIVITETKVVSFISQNIIINNILKRDDIFNLKPKRAKFIVIDIYGTLYRSRLRINNNNNNIMIVNPIQCPLVTDSVQNYPFILYPTLMEVFCYQNVPWIINYSIQDELKLFQKAISVGYILPIPKFLDNININNNDNNNQLDQKSKYNLIKFILNNKPLRIVIFQHVTSIHQQLGIKTVKLTDITTLYDYIKYGQTDLFIKHFDHLHQLILLVDKQSKRYKMVINNNYIERLYWVFHMIFLKNNHVAMKHLIDRLVITKLDFLSYKSHFMTYCYQFTTEMFYVLRDANFSTTVPFLQHEMINVLVRLGDCDQLESYLSKLDDATHSPPSPHPFKSSFSYLLNSTNKTTMYTIDNIIYKFKRYAINVIGDVLIGALENNHLEMIKWIVENVPEKKLIAYCQDQVIFNVFETHCKKDVLEMLPIPLNPPYAQGGNEAIRIGNLDFLEYFLKTPRENGRVIRMLNECLAFGRLDCFELILSKNPDLQIQKTVTNKIHPNCFSTSFVSRLIGMGFYVHLMDGIIETAIRSNQLDTLVQLESPQLPLRVEKFTKLLGYAIECNSLSSIDVLLHHPRFQGFLSPTINLHCITLQSHIPTIEYVLSKSPLPFNFKWDFASPIDYVLASKVIRLVYKPHILGHCQLIGIFLFANDTEWLYEQKIITKSPDSVSALFDDDRSGALASLFDIACQKGYYKALDFLFDNCLPHQINNHLLLTSLVRLPDDQQFERFWTKRFVTESAVVSSIVHTIILRPKDHNSKRAKSIVDIYGTFYKINSIMTPIEYPSMETLGSHPFAHYSTLMEVFCCQNVPWIINYSVQDELKIFQKAITLGYIPPTSSSSELVNEINKKSKCNLIKFGYHVISRHGLGDSL